ncbi:MAG: BON domain-containing protein [Kofleriaceae bacterium]
MANQNYGHPRRREERDEHGYQDPRDRGDFHDYRPGSGYGYDDDGRDQGRDLANYRRDDTEFRGQSGSHAGFGGNNRSWGNQGGNPGRWGEFDRGGRWSPASHDVEYNSQSPHAGRSDHYSRFGGYGEGQYDMQNSWRRDQRQWRDHDNYDDSNRQMNRGGYGFEGQSGYTGGQYANRDGGYGYARGPHVGKGPAGYQRSDERIKEIVNDALTEHGHVDASNITVDVKNGEVTLTGHVDDRDAKRLAEDIAASQSGVKDVANQLRVGPPMSGGASMTKKNGPAT